MENCIKKWKAMVLLGAILLSADSAFAQQVTADSLPGRFIHRLGVEFRPGYVVPTHEFLRGENQYRQLIRNSLSAHLQYSFQFRPDTYAGRIYSSAYQGVGLAAYSFGSGEEIGSPVALYLFQGARIAQFSPRLSFNYEWNFGISAGWKPYDFDTNNYNKVIGSKLNAYLNTDFYLSWMLAPQIDLTAGVALTHFSNGNTEIPNAGLNTVGLKVGLVYNLNRPTSFRQPTYRPLIPAFPQHISYDLVLFGSWRRKGVDYGDEQVASPYTYTVLGFNFAPMYNIGYKFRVGVSLDGVYDGSANVYTKDYIVGTEQPFYKPSLSKQLALGLSGRLEYVMPYFTVGIGLGANVLHGGGDLKSFYQVLALKVEVTRSSFIHVGYCLQNFHTPNYLMLGIGYRFHNKYPTFHR